MTNVAIFTSEECRKIRSFLDDFISGELSVETSRQLLEHLDRCPDCQEEKDQRERLRFSIRKAWNSISSPESVRVDIQKQIPSGRSAVPWAFRIAAGVVIATLSILAYFAGPGIWQNDSRQLVVVDHYREVVLDHLRCSGLSRQGRQLPLRPAHLDIGNQLAAAGSLQLVGVLECKVNDATFVHFILSEQDGSMVSILLEERSSDQVLPADDPAITLLGVTVRTISREKLMLHSIEAPHHFVYLVSEKDDPVHARHLTEEVLPSLKKTVFTFS
jgi:hypothetical protein